MVELSSECIERLRVLDRGLGLLATHINRLADPGATHRLALDVAARLALTAPLTVPAPDPDEDCKNIFKAIDPLLRLIVASITDDQPVHIIRRHLESTRAYIQTSQIAF